MRNRRLLVAVVAAVTMLVGTLGMALWPSPAGAAYGVRKFTGVVLINEHFNNAVLVHNPLPAATLKVEVVIRNFNGVERQKTALSISANSVASVVVPGSGTTTVEVNMNNAVGQPSMRFLSAHTGAWELVYAGDFSR